MIKSVDVPCPFCSAKVDEPCKTGPGPRIEGQPTWLWHFGRLQYKTTLLRTYPVIVESPRTPS